MTTTTASSHNSARPGYMAIPGLLWAPFRLIGRGLMALSNRRSDILMREVEALNRLSDPELARRGLRRDDILRHVFRGSAWM